MTKSQFDALAKLLQMRTGPAQDAARMVLLGGQPQVTAAAATGITVASVSNAVVRCRRALALATLAAGLSADVQTDSPKIPQKTRAPL